MRLIRRKKPIERVLTIKIILKSAKRWRICVVKLLIVSMRNILTGKMKPSMKLENTMMNLVLSLTL